MATFLLCTGLCAVAQGGGRPAAAPAASVQGPDLQALVNGLERAQRENHQHMVPYSVIREYQLFSDGQPQPSSTVLAEVRFQPPFTKTWTIRQTSGSSRAERVVRSILEREVRFARDGKIAISRQDYDFRYAGPGEDAGRPCHIVELLPKRKDSDLLRGRMWVDRDTYLIHHFEGEPAKSPSWWVKDLKLSMDYGDMAGMWLQSASKGVAEVRLLGQHTMTERTLRCQAAGRVVEGPVSRLSRLTELSSRGRRRVPVAVVGAGVVSGR